MYKNKLKYNKGETGLGMILLLLLVGLFIIWVLTGGATQNRTRDGFTTEPIKVITPIQPIN